MTLNKGLNLSGVSLEIRQKHLLGPLDLDIPIGGLTVLMGANGAGKSLFLKVVHGLLTPTSGRVTWDGKLPAEIRNTQSYVFQRPVVMRRSLRANVEYPLKLRRVEKNKRRELTDQALQQVYLLEKADAAAATLSGGELQRMALARALIINPDVLLLDEPTAHLDPQATELFEQIISKIQTQSVQIILTTHDIRQARRLADRIIFMDQGLVTDLQKADLFFAGDRSTAADKYFQGLI